MLFKRGYTVLLGVLLLVATGLMLSAAFSEKPSKTGIPCPAADKQCCLKQKETPYYPKETISDHIFLL